MCKFGVGDEEGGLVMAPELHSASIEKPKSFASQQTYIKDVSGRCGYLCTGKVPLDGGGNRTAYSTRNDCVIG